MCDTMSCIDSFLSFCTLALIARGPRSCRIDFRVYIYIFFFLASFKVRVSYSCLNSEEVLATPKKKSPFRVLYCA